MGRTVIAMVLVVATSIAAPGVAQTPQSQRNNSTDRTAGVEALDVATRAQLMEAQIALIEEDYDFSLRTYRRLATRGIAEAQSYLGYMHANGLGVNRDYREAIRLYRLAANQNYAGALFNLGFMYRNGLGLPRDVTEGARLYQLAADQGDPDALEFLSRFLTTSSGPPTPISNTRGNGSEGRPSGATEPSPTAAIRPSGPAAATPRAASLPNAGAGTSISNVRLIREGGTYKIPVQINGILELNFTVDSGASVVTVPADVVLTLIRTGTITENDFIGQETYGLADGRQIRSENFIIRQLRVGDRVIMNVLGTVADVQGSLLLGQSFLSRFRRVSFDYSRGVLALE